MIGKRLARLRKGIKMGQEELAQILGVTKHSVSMYENNKSTPSDNGYILIAKTFNVSIDYLMGLVDEPYSYMRDWRNIIRIPEALPNEAKILLDDFVEYLRLKYEK